MVSLSLNICEKRLLTTKYRLFIITGAITFFVALLSMYLLPDTPLTTRWLSHEERQLAHERIIRDTTEESGRSTTWNGFKQAMLDYRTWLFCLMYNFHLTAYELYLRKASWFPQTNSFAL